MKTKMVACLLLAVTGLVSAADEARRQEVPQAQPVVASPARDPLPQETAVAVSAESAPLGKDDLIRSTQARAEFQPLETVDPMTVSFAPCGFSRAWGVREKIRYLQSQGEDVSALVDLYWKLIASALLREGAPL